MHRVLLLVSAFVVPPLSIHFESGSQPRILGLIRNER